MEQKANKTIDTNKPTSPSISHRHRGASTLSSLSLLIELQPAHLIKSANEEGPDLIDLHEREVVHLSLSYNKVMSMWVGITRLLVARWAQTGSRNPFPTPSLLNCLAIDAGSRCRIKYHLSLSSSNDLPADRLPSTLLDPLWPCSAWFHVNL